MLEIVLVTVVVAVIVIADLDSCYEKESEICSAKNMIAAIVIARVS